MHGYVDAIASLSIELCGMKQYTTMEQRVLHITDIWTHFHHSYGATICLYYLLLEMELRLPLTPHPECGDVGLGAPHRNVGGSVG
jgi:hypothetical protein